MNKTLLALMATLSLALCACSEEDSLKQVTHGLDLTLCSASRTTL